MRKLFFGIAAIMLSSPAWCQIEQVGKGVFPENQAFGFSMTPDRKTAFFVRSFSGRDSLIIYTSQWKNGQWQKPSPASFTAKPGVWKDIDPFVSPDGQHLFFQSNRGLQKNDPARKHFDIWVTDKTSKGWSEPRHLGPVVNSDSSESFLSATASGKLYFGSSRAGGFGKIDIYSSEIKNRVYQEPINLGKTINSADHDTNPFISHDESFLIVSLRSERPNKDSDLYISFNINGKWTKPLSLGDEINSSISEFCPFVSQGEDTLYFARLDKNKRFHENIFKGHLPIGKLKAMAISLKE
jgi:hypothetical protein